MKLIKYLGKIKKFLKKKIDTPINKILFKKIGKNCLIHRQIIFTNKNRVSLGDNVIIFPNGRIELIDYYNKNFQPYLSIGSDSQIHQNCHITCADKIIIGKNVTIVANVTITDIIHPHMDISKPINQTDIITKPVIIGDETYIYNNAVILPGSQIGKHCIIGANSLISGKIPDYSIVVGSPGRIVKKFNFLNNAWEKI